MEPINIDAAFESFDETWAPRLAAELNGQEIKLAKLEGEFVWHCHPEADELFLVTEGGPLDIEVRDEPTVTVGEGEMIVVPAGTHHRPVAHEVTHAILFEPAGTENTGTAESDRTSKVRPFDQ